MTPIVRASTPLTRWATMTDEEIVNKFTFHPATPDQVERYVLLRAKALEFAQLVMELAPGSRERSSAITSIDVAVMHANAAIARHS